MLYRLLDETDGLRTIVAVLDHGDEAMASLQWLAEEENLSAATISGLGAFERAVVLFWDWDTKAYEEIPVGEQVEVLNLTGDIALDEDGAPKLHVHTVLGRRDGAAIGGHLKEGRVRPTLEIIVTETPAHLHRRHDPTTGLALIDLKAR